jgi:hypothetical protein
MFPFRIILLSPCLKALQIDRGLLPMIRLTMNSMRKMKKRTFAMSIDVPAMFVKPNSAATIEMMRKIIDHVSISRSFLDY